jgi:hypothetical protein
MFFDLTSEFFEVIFLILHGILMDKFRKVFIDLLVIFR